MSKISVLPPSGFRDFSPDEALLRQFLLEKITQIYRSFGFQPIATSLVENLATLQGKGGGSDNEKLIFKLLKRGEDLQRSLQEGKELADMGLRFDLTLPLARFYAKNRGELPRPFKVFQIAPVWRADRPQKGRYREFYQCDVDIIGANEIGAELDCILAITTVFSLLGISGIEVHINDRRLLSALGEELGITGDLWAKFLVSIDKLDKIGVGGVLAEAAQIHPLSDAQINQLKEVLEANGTAVKNRFLASNREEVKAVVTDLDSLTQALQISSTKIVFNPSLVRGQDYYTGTIFEIRHPDLSGSLAGGGRYNRLLEIFGAESTPAFGGSIGFERLVLLLQEKALEQIKKLRPQVFFPLFSAAQRPIITQLAQELRAAGLQVDIYPDAAKLKNQFKYANDRQIPFVAIIGEAEAAAGEVKLKNMHTSTETSFSFREFPAKIAELCRNL